MAEGLVIQGTEALNAYLTKLSRNVPAATGRMLFQAGEAIREYMVTNYLSGQRLHRRSGRLAGGFSTVVASDRASAVVGTRVRYARVHEEGSHEIVQVKAHFRRPSRSNTRRASRFGAEAEATIAVRAHPMRMNIRAKHYAADARTFGAPAAMRAANAVAAAWIASGDART